MVLELADKAWTEGKASEWIGAASGKTYSLLLTPISETDYLNAYGRDVTAQRLAEEKLRSVARFPDENPNPILRADTGGILLYANLTSRELLDRWRVAVGQPLPDWLRAEIRATAIAGKSNEVETVCGSDTFALVLAPVTDEGYVNLYGYNITRRAQSLVQAGS